MPACRVFSRCQQKPNVRNIRKPDGSSPSPRDALNSDFDPQSPTSSQAVALIRVLTLSDRAPWLSPNLWKNRRKGMRDKPAIPCQQIRDLTPAPGHGLPDDCQHEHAETETSPVEHRRKEVDDRGAFCSRRPRGLAAAPSRPQAGKRSGSCRSREASRRKGRQDLPRIVPPSGSNRPPQSGDSRGGRTFDVQEGGVVAHHSIPKLAFASGVLAQGSPGILPMSHSNMVLTA